MPSVGTLLPGFMIKVSLTTSSAKDISSSWPPRTTSAFSGAKLRSLRIASDTLPRDNASKYLPSIMNDIRAALDSQNG
ncbi:MAG: hypothetical protein UU22_C0016G0032 [Parcubacteria group bacterium GW2011_GWA2_40_8]|nr:MAG: hypothetical protein UU22_C0016G0032 [Parcubacteria group bacterium GW2011_GWA2_40_8]